VLLDSMLAIPACLCSIPGLQLGIHHSQIKASSLWNYLERFIISHSKVKIQKRFIVVSWWGLLFCRFVKAVSNLAVSCFVQSFFPLSNITELHTSFFRMHPAMHRICFLTRYEILDDQQLPRPHLPVGNYPIERAATRSRLKRGFPSPASWRKIRAQSAPM
jgi:hypothetical protein